MATKVIPARTIQVCDVCGGHGGTPYRCLMCDREHCYQCKGVVTASMVSPEVCRDCDNLPHVKDVCREYGRKIAELIVERNKKLKPKLPE